ncbi:MAG: hypothetical protein FWC43_09085, partial [Planctomycetaceae bacterium]|nr:hypothetical protein [Planctomycetaceae bacterium]
FDTYPALKLLTGDAIFAQRPLLEALQEYECDYLFQVKENQEKVYLELSGLGQVWIALTNAALSVLRLVQVPGKPLTQTAENFHYSPRKALQMFGFSIF